jgi:hypothetical protein
MKEIILVEGKIDFNIIQKKIFENKSLVVSFDFNSHKILKQNKIKHELVEDYFSEKDKMEIDNFSLKIGTTWYKDKKITQYLEYDKINLGSLLELEMPSYFLKILKRIIGIKKIVEKEKPEKIISYSLKKYVNEYYKMKKIKIENYEKIKETSLFFDEISIPLSLGGTTKNIKISRKNYFKLKKMTDKISNSIWRTKLNKKELQNNESILLIDFNTKLYQDFLKSFPNSNKNIIILNQRKPAIWNLETLKIIKKSNCKILDIEDFENEKTKKKNELEQKKLSEKIKQILNQENSLSTIFSLNNESFWNIIKDEFSEIISKRFSESIKRLILINEVFHKMNIKSVLDWAHTGMEEKEISFIANKKKIPIFCLQHGIMTLNPKFNKYHSIMPVLPSNNSKMLVWGKIMKDYLLEQNVSSKDITIVGSPRHDRFFKQKLNKNNNTILIASNLFFHVNFDGNDTRAVERFELFLKETLQYIKKNSKKKIIIKLHATEYFDIKPIIKKIDSTIPVYQHEDILKLLESCEVLISLNYSTVLLDALILNKPTLVFLPEKQNFEKEEIIKQNAVLTVSNRSELENKIEEILFDQNIRNNLIKNGKLFIEKYFSHQGNSCEVLKNKLLD